MDSDDDDNNKEMVIIQLYGHLFLGRCFFFIYDCATIPTYKANICNQALSMWSIVLLHRCTHTKNAQWAVWIVYDIRLIVERTKRKNECQISERILELNNGMH